MSRYDRVSRYCTRVEGDTMAGNVRYHSTDIVHWDPTTIVLRTGGWPTVTTKRKMNQAAREFDLGFSVYQKKHQWYLVLQNGTFQFPNKPVSIYRATGDVWIDGNLQTPISE